MNTENQQRSISERLARSYLYVLSVIIAAVGMMYLIDPAGAMVAAEISIRSAAGTTEIRGMYGGLHLALSIFLVLIMRRGLLQPALQLMALVFGCVALGRLLGFGVAWQADTYNLLVTAAEIGISSIALVLLYVRAAQLKEGSPSQPAAH